MFTPSRASSIIPGFELVGLWVHNPEKLNQDAGALCGRASVGVSATRTIDELLALDADCVCYNATDTARQSDVVDELCQILRSGKNVVGTTITGLVFPPGVPDIWSRLTSACEVGHTSLHIAGVHPGFMLDALPLVLSSGTQTVRSVTVAEILDISTHSNILTGLGFGRTPEDDSGQFLMPIIEHFWGSAVRLLAFGLGIELDELRPFRHVAVTETPLQTASLTVPPGTIGAVRMGLEGIAGDQVVIRLEQLYRLGIEVAPEWPQPPGRGGYRIEINGSPNIRAEITVDSDESDPCSEVVRAAAMRAVNAIPAVCDAPPGAHTFLSLAPWTGHAELTKPFAT